MFCCEKRSVYLYDLVDTYDLIFTLVDGPNIDVELPDEAKRPIDEAKQLIQQAVDAGTFVIYVRWRYPRVTSSLISCRFLLMMTGREASTLQPQS